MHGFETIQEFYYRISGFLSAFYLALAVMNSIYAMYQWKTKGNKKVALIWVCVAIVFTIMSPIAASGNGSIMQLISIPQVFRDLFDMAMAPATYTLGSLVVLAILYKFREFCVQPMVAWTGLNLALLFMGMSMTDRDFAAIVTKPDNVPIVGLIFLLGFFTWLATYKAVENDKRIARGERPLEALDDEKVLVWPDLVYTELICMVALTAFMLLWAIGLQAPLEEPASSVKTPNPSKAPWYFLGLQEMLVYYDPWMAGVVLPSMVVAGLMAIPYIDFNKRGNGYYTIKERQFSYVTFQIGFLVLWVTLIVMGTFLRGPNWNFFGIYETWDVHKVEAMNNVDLSQYFWVELLNKPLPKPGPEDGFIMSIATILLRECVGIILVVLYFAIIPPLMALKSKFFGDMYKRMGLIRFMVMAQLLLWMALLPIKMLLRWTVDMKYFISIPEYFLNF